MGIRALDVFAACGPPVVASGAMYAVIATARGALVAQPEAVALSVLIGAGAVAYLAVMVLISRRHLADAYGLARSFLGRDPTKAA